MEKGTIATASGWGYTSNPGQAAANLKWVQVKTMDGEYCKSQMSRSNAAKVFKSSICAEVIEEEGGACLGDSGGKNS